jgi:tetratricopeptide (TPR) repeat protein
MRYDFNVLKKKAEELMNTGRQADALKIYLFMADGDQSLDAGYLGEKIAQCYEMMGNMHEAKYWYGRCVEENPEVRTDCVKARERLKSVTIDDLVPPEEYVAE